MTTIRIALLLLTLAALIPSAAFWIMFRPLPREADESRFGFRVATALQLKAAALTIALGWTFFSQATRLMGIDLSRTVSLVVGVFALAFVAVATNYQFITYLKVRKNQ